MPNLNEVERARILLEAKRLGQQAAIDEALTVLRLAGVDFYSYGGFEFFDTETGETLRE